MSDLTLDQLSPYKEPVNIFDSKGKLLGIFLPTDVIARPCSAPPIDADEIERRENGVRYPNEDVLQRLKALAAETDRRKAAGEREMTTAEALAFIDHLSASARQAS